MRTLLMFVLGALMCACTTDAYTETTISILEDLTEDDFALTPSEDNVLPLLNLKENMWQGQRFRYGTLSDMEHTKRQEFILESEAELFGNSFKRKQKVQKYRKQITELLQESKDSTGYPYSAIWEPLVKEIQELQSKTNSISTLYLFSDLQENVEWFSVHNSRDYQKLKNDAQSVVKLYAEKAVAIKNTSHVSVVVAYRPTTRREDKTFKIMKELYTKVFHELGVPITFVANLNTPLS